MSTPGTAPRSGSPSEVTSDLTKNRRGGPTESDTAPASPPRPSIGARILLALIALYRATASIRQPRCRFSPTCSQYASESIREHGALRGGWYAIRRIGRCHPWNPGGLDPVPPRK